MLSTWKPKEEKSFCLAWNAASHHVELPMAVAWCTQGSFPQHQEHPYPKVRNSAHLCFLPRTAQHCRVMTDPHLRASSAQDHLQINLHISSGPGPSQASCFEMLPFITMVRWMQPPPPTEDVHEVLQSKLIEGSHLKMSIFWKQLFSRGGRGSHSAISCYRWSFKHNKSSLSTLSRYFS